MEQDGGALVMEFMINKNKKKLIELAEVLLTKEVIFKDNLEEIFGKRPFEKEVVAVEKKK